MTRQTTFTGPWAAPWGAAVVQWPVRRTRETERTKFKERKLKRKSQLGLGGFVTN